MGVYGIGVLEKKIHDRCYNTRGYNYSSPTDRLCL